MGFDLTEVPSDVPTIHEAISWMRRQMELDEEYARDWVREDADHPADVLADVRGKRAALRLVEDLLYDTAQLVADGDHNGRVVNQVARTIVLSLVSCYATRDGYQDEWVPTPVLLITDGAENEES